jgi:hypothetical protein
VNKSFPDALAPFKSVVEKYPQSRKVPDALLKIGYCDYELKQFPSGARRCSRRWSRSIRTRPPPSWRRQRLDKWRRRSIE